MSDLSSTRSLEIPPRSISQTSILELYDVGLISSKCNKKEITDIMFFYEHFNMAILIFRHFKARSLNIILYIFPLQGSGGSKGPRG